MREAIVVTDDLGMHKLADEFEIVVWHAYDLLKKMLRAKAIDKELIREIYTALENNNDYPLSWREAKHSKFNKIFGAKPET